MPPETRREVIRLARKGASYRDIKGRIDVSMGAIGFGAQAPGWGVA